MADVADMAAEIEDEDRLRAILAARAAAIPAGVAGECDGCGEDMPRLVEGLCALCRDGRTVIAPVVRGVDRSALPVAARCHRSAGVAPETARAIEAVAVAAVSVTQEARKREAEMGERSRQVTFQAKGEVLDAIEAAAAAGTGAMGPAALALVEAGLRAEVIAQEPPASAEASTRAQRLQAHVAGIHALFDEIGEEAERAGDTADLEERLGEAITRAEAAEAQVAQIRAMLS